MPVTPRVWRRAQRHVHAQPIVLASVQRAHDGAGAVVFSVDVDVVHMGNGGDDRFGSRPLLQRTWKIGARWRGASTGWLLGKRIAQHHLAKVVLAAAQRFRCVHGRCHACQFVGAQQEYIGPRAHDHQRRIVGIATTGVAAQPNIQHHVCVAHLGVRQRIVARIRAHIGAYKTKMIDFPEQQAVLAVGPERQHAMPIDIRRQRQAVQVVAGLALVEDALEHGALLCRQCVTIGRRCIGDGCGPVDRVTEQGMQCQRIDLVDPSHLHRTQHLIDFVDLARSERAALFARGGKQVG